MEVKKSFTGYFDESQNIFKFKNFLLSPKGSVQYFPELGIDLSKIKSMSVDISIDTFSRYVIHHANENGHIPEMLICSLTSDNEIVIKFKFDGIEDSVTYDKEFINKYIR